MNKLQERREKCIGEFIRQTNKETEERFYALKEKGVKTDDLENMKVDSLKKAFEDIESRTEDHVDKIKESVEFLKVHKQELFEEIFGYMKGLNWKGKNKKSKKSNLQNIDNIELSEEFTEKLHEESLNSFNNDSFEEAYHIAEVLSSLDPENPRYRYLKAVSLMSLGELDRAIEDLNVNIQFHPDYEFSYLSIIECLIMNKELEKAREIHSEVKECLKLNKGIFEDPDFFNEKMDQLENMMNQ